MSTKTNKNKNNNKKYQIVNKNENITIILDTALPYLKKGKTLTLKTKNKTLRLNGYQIKTLKHVLSKENSVNEELNNI